MVDNKLRVWWIPQVWSSKTFYVPVQSVVEGKKILDILAVYDGFQLQNNIKPDYCNVGGLQMLMDGELVDWYQETEDDYFEDLDEYCDQCDEAKELKEFVQELYGQVDWENLNK